MEISLEGECADLSDPLGRTGTELLRIIGEALTNARRHSGATSHSEPQPREMEVLQLLAEGIAVRLHISLRTERNHMASILSKLGVHSQLQALVFALRHGAVEIH